MHQANHGVILGNSKFWGVCDEDVKHPHHKGVTLEYHKYWVSEIFLGSFVKQGYELSFLAILIIRFHFLAFQILSWLFYFFYFLIMLWTEELRTLVFSVFIHLWHLHHLTLLTIHMPYRLMNVSSSWNLLFGFSILLKSAAFSYSRFGSWFFPPLQDRLTITDTLSRSATTLACPCAMYTYPENPCCEDIYSQPNITSVSSGIFF